MTTHIPHPHTTAAIQALEAANEMADDLQQVRDLNRIILQMGTFDDVVEDDRDRLAFLTLTRMADDLLDQIEGLRSTIVRACHAAKYGAGKLAA